MLKCCYTLPLVIVRPFKASVWVLIQQEKWLHKCGPIILYTNSHGSTRTSVEETKHFIHNYSFSSVWSNTGVKETPWERALFCTLVSWTLNGQRAPCLCEPNIDGVIFPLLLQISSSFVSHLICIVSRVFVSLNAWKLKITIWILLQAYIKHVYFLICNYSWFV
jgi:hypothetical protein